MFPYILQEQEKKIVLKTLLGKIRNLKFTKSIAQDFLSLVSLSGQIPPTIKSHVLDRVVIALHAEFEYQTKKIFESFLAKQSELDEQMTTCLIKRIDMRNLKFGNVKGNIKSFIKNCLGKQISNEIEDKFTESCSRYFEDFEEKHDEYIKNIWNKVLSDERNSISHNPYNYNGEEYFVYYAILMVDCFLQSLKEILDGI